MPALTYQDHELVQAVAVSRSWRGVLRELGLKGTSAQASRSVRRHADRLALDYSHFTGGRGWTVDQFRRAVETSRTWAEVVQLLGLSGGSSQTALKGHATRLGIDVSHLNAGVVAPPAGLSTMVPSLRNLPIAGSTLAAAHLMLSGYQVAWPLEPCAYDLLASREDETIRVQVKTSRQRRGGSWVAALNSTSRKCRVYDPDDIDSFFVIDGDLNYFWLPVAVVGGLQQVNLNKYVEFRLDREIRRDTALQPT